MNVKLIGNHRRKIKRHSVPVLVALLDVLYETWEYIINLFFWICYSTYVSYIHLYYFKKLPVYSGLTNLYQISLKTKYFIFISIFNMFLPKLLEPTCTSEYLTTRRYKKMLKLLEIFRTMILETSWKKTPSKLLQVHVFAKDSPWKCLHDRQLYFFHIILSWQITNEWCLRKHYLCFSIKLIGERIWQTYLLKYSLFSKMNFPAPSLPYCMFFS